ncbi:MAG: methyltransferase [Planctomycetota bacterium]|nr:methyltransferase [Planctomycetota bacterium]
MLGRVWERLRRKLGGATRYPAPVVADPDVVPRLQSALAEFYDGSERRFRRLFLDGKPIPARTHEQPWLDLCADAGLVEKRSLGIYVPRVLVFPLHGAMIATDLLSHGDADQVFSLMLEQLYLVATMDVRHGDRVLELCVGSGVNSLFAAEVAAAVTGVDLSPRALEFARFNAALNPGCVPVELKQGSLFEPLAAGERYDLILVNPPFEPVPPGAGHFLHSHGGEDGLDVVRTILAEAPGRLAAGGRFEMFTWSPGDDDGVLVADLLRAAFPGRRLEIHRVDSRPLDDRIAQFSGAKDFAAWRDRLAAAGYTRVWGVFTRVCGAGPADTEFVERPETLAECRAILAEWT